MTRGRSSDSRKMRPVWRWLLCTEALDGPHDRGAGNTFFTQVLDDRLIERFAVPEIRLTDENAKKFAFACKPHIALPAVVPIHTAKDADRHRCNAH